MNEKRITNLTFSKVETSADQKRLAEIAYGIWNEYWPPLIGQDQVDYMIEHFQSLEAIQRDMAEQGYEYWFLEADNAGAAGEAGEAGERTEAGEGGDAGTADGAGAADDACKGDEAGEANEAVAANGTESTHCADNALGASATQGIKRLVGYTGGHPEPETNRYFISKIYLLKDERGRGIARRVIDFYDEHARELGFHATYLTVNKHNTPAVRSYEKNGFAIIDAVETDIGSGFIMDDFIMERPVS